jgi:pimeloyl-ACP methyl ester carboxylesterase
MPEIILDDIRLYYDESGFGPVVLLVHGFPFDSSIWKEQIAALSESYRVLAVDLRGFGQSSVTRPVVTIDQFSDDLARVLDKLAIDEPVTVCGLSMGGYIALAFCRKYPYRLGRLILCDTRAGADSPEVAAARHALADAVEQPDSTEDWVDSMIPKLFDPKTFEQDPDRIDSVRRMMLAQDRFGVAAASRGMAERTDSTELLSCIGVPTLLLVGQSDQPSPPAEMRSMAERITGAHLVEIPDSGHLTPVEQPELVNREFLDFLAETD